MQICGVPCLKEALKLMKCCCPFFLMLKLALGFWSRKNRRKCRRSINCHLTLGSLCSGKTNFFEVTFSLWNAGKWRRKMTPGSEQRGLRSSACCYSWTVLCWKQLPFNNNVLNTEYSDHERKVVFGGCRQHFHWGQSVGERGIENGCIF